MQKIQRNIEINTNQVNQVLITCFFFIVFNQNWRIGRGNYKLGSDIRNVSTDDLACLWLGFVSFTVNLKSNIIKHLKSYKVTRIHKNILFLKNSVELTF